MPPQTLEPQIGSSPRLRLFLVGARAVGLILALALTQMHSIAEGRQLPALLGHPGLISTAVVLYYLAGGALFYRASSRGPAFLLLFLDVAAGLSLTYYFGPAYLLLGFAVPVLTTAFFFGTAGAVMAVLVGGLFYSVVLGFPLVQEMGRQGAGPAVREFLQVAGVQVALTLLLLWLYLLAVAEVEERSRVERSAGQEKDLLFQELQETRAQIDAVRYEVADRESALRAVKKSLDETREELESAYRRLHEAREQAQSTEKIARHKEQHFMQAMTKEKQRFGQEVLKLKQIVERQTGLLEIFREISGKLTLSDTLLAITEKLQELLPSQTCVVFLVDEVEGHRELFAEVAASPFTDRFRNFSLQLGEQAPGFAASSRQAFRIDDRRIVLEGREVPTLLEAERSALVIPLETEGQVHGVVYLGRPGAGEFSDDELELGVEFCRYSSLALANAIRFQQTVTSGIHDSHTHLYNSLYLEERMREEVKRGRRYTYPVSLVLVDIDDFAGVNERMGEEVADHLLAEMAEILREATRETDVPARLEGDDFAILLVHSDRESAFGIAERLRQTVESRSFGPASRKTRITVSIGVAGLPHDGVNEEQLTMRATAALQMARQYGGNCCAFWNAIPEKR